LPKYKSTYKDTPNEWKGKIKLVLILSFPSAAYLQRKLKIHQTSGKAK